MYEFKFPDVAEGIHEGKLVAWRIKVGDIIEHDGALCEMETDKSVLEITSPIKGKIAKLHFNQGDNVKVGQILVTIDETGSGFADASVQKEPFVLQPSQQAPVAKPIQSTGFTQTNGSAKILILPKNRALAKELGVDITRIQGTGENGRITIDDIKRAKEGKNYSEIKAEKPAEAKQTEDLADFMKSLRVPPSIRRKALELGISPDKIYTSAASAQNLQKTQQPIPEIKNLVPHTEGENRIKIDGVRAIIKKRMEDSWKNVPHAAVAIEAEAAKLVQLKENKKEEYAKKGIKLTYLPFVAKAVASALEKFPKFNASIDEATQEFVLKKNINVGIAVDTEYGLIVPNIKDTNKKSISEIAKEIQELAQKAREKKLSLQEITGGTFSITNVGSFGAINGFATINYPEVSILMLLKIIDKFVLENERPVGKKILPLYLSFDHRIVDGADAGRFLQHMADFLNNLGDVG